MSAEKAEGRYHLEEDNIILAFLEDGKSFADIAEIYEISESTVRRVANKIPERHIETRNAWEELKQTELFQALIIKDNPNSYKSLVA